MGCFNRNEVAALTGNLRTADSLLYSYKKRGIIEAVRYNYYVALSPESNQPVCSPYQLASNISPSSYVSHHSAFEFYGMANQVFNEIYVASDSKFSDFDFDGKHFKYVSSKTLEGVKNYGSVRVTDLERTIIDSIKDFPKIGGLEELYCCMDAVTAVSVENLLKYLEIYNTKFLWQKVGFVLSCFPHIRIQNGFFDICKKNSPNEPRYLYSDLKTEKHVLSREWNLYVPDNILTSPGGNAVT